MNDGAEVQISTRSACRFSEPVVSVFEVMVPAGGMEPCMKCSALHCVLRHAVAERPVLLLHLDEIDEDVFHPEADRGVEAFGDGLVERFLLLDRSALVPGDLDDH